MIAYIIVISLAFIYIKTYSKNCHNKCETCTRNCRKRNEDI